MPRRRDRGRPTDFEVLEVALDLVGTVGERHCSLGFSDHISCDKIHAARGPKNALTELRVGEAKFLP
jgi:hypothetical protein